MPRQIRSDNLSPARPRVAAALLRLVRELGWMPAPRADQDEGWWKSVENDPRLAPRQSDPTRSGMILVTRDGRRWMPDHTTRYVMKYFQPDRRGDITIGPEDGEVMDAMLAGVAHRDENLGMDVRWIVLSAMKTVVRLVPD